MNIILYFCKQYFATKKHLSFNFIATLFQFEELHCDVVLIALIRPVFQ